jgi:hypothetical protein
MGIVRYRFIEAAPTHAILRRMAFETIDHQPTPSRYPRRNSRRRRRSLLEITLVAGFLFCLVVGLIALGVLFWLRTPARAVDISSTPALAIQPERISPSLALMQLAGDSADALVNQALTAGHLDTAFTIAAYGTDLSPTLRRTLFLQLGQRFAAADRSAEAVIALRAARALAILTPEQTPADRHQALVATANAFLALNEIEAAQDTVAQALRVVAQTPNLLPAQRAEVFEALRPAAQQAGSDLLAAQASEYARNPFLTPSGHMLTPQLSAIAVFAPPDATVAQAAEQRHFAARLLAERILLTGGIDIEPEQQALEQALLVEDAAQSDMYRFAQAAPDITARAQLGFLLQRRDWLALKARIAQRGFGLSLVPEWEANAGFILQDLSTVHNNINTTLDVISNEISDPVAQSSLRLEVLLDLARQWELGLHPDGLGADIGERMRIVQDELARLDHPMALPIVFVADAEPPGFRVGRQ